MITLIDGNNILHATYHASKLRVFNLEHLLKFYIARFEQFRRDYENVVIVFDGDRAKVSQQQTVDDYKEGRSKHDEILTSSFLPIRSILKFLGYSVLYNKNLEADQVIASVAYANRKTGALIISTDKDFNGMICKTITVYDPRYKIHRNEQYVIDRYKVTPKQFGFYLALVGDAVDNIPGLSGCGPDKATKFIAKYNSLSNAITEIENSSFELSKIELDFINSKELITKYYSLTNLRKERTIFPIVKEKLDRDKLKSFCRESDIDYAMIFERKTKF